MYRLIAGFAALTLTATAGAQPKPAFVYESLLDGDFSDESGLISFTAYDLAFAPEKPLKAVVAVTDADGAVIESFPFYEDYGTHNGVFARAQVQGPADVQLTEPGVYNIIMFVDGEMATRLFVVLEQTDEGDDPFDPVKKHRFYGPWQLHAHLVEETYDDEPYYDLTFWVGGRDLAEGDDDDLFFVTLLRNGEVIGHSKRTQGHIAPGHYERVSSSIFYPHGEKGSPNAGYLPRSEWTADGDYEVRVMRRSDDAVIRSFRYEAKDGEIGRLDRTQLGYEPRIDYIVPRVTKKSWTTYEFAEAIWITGSPPGDPAKTSR